MTEREHDEGAEQTRPAPQPRSPITNVLTFKSTGERMAALADLSDDPPRYIAPDTDPA